MTADDDEQGSPRRFNIYLLIAHPSLSPAVITRGMRWRPHNAHEAGAPRRTPKGTQLPGRYFDTRWGYGWRYVARGQHFAGALDAAVRALEQRAPFLRRLLGSGGAISLSVNFLGDGYFGDNIPPDTLARLAGLGVSLGIQVFQVRQNEHRGLRRRPFP